MKKSILSLATALVALALSNASAFELLSYGNFDHWITRQISESHILGGNTKTVYEIGPTQTIVGNKPYVNLGGSPWGTSNVYAKVHGIVKASNAVYPDTHNGGHCAKLTTKLEHVKALGIINMDVLVGGTIFTGQMIEPVKSTSNPYADIRNHSGFQSYMGLIPKAKSYYARNSKG